MFEDTLRFTAGPLAPEFPNFYDDMVTLSRDAIAEMGLSIPASWDLGYRHDLRDAGWFLIALVADQRGLVYEAELETGEEFSDGDLTEVCTEAVLAAIKQEGI
jgi:hypothetical protein